MGNALDHARRERGLMERNLSERLLTAWVGAALLLWGILSHA